MKKLTRKEVIVELANAEANKMLNNKIVSFTFFYELAMQGLRGLNDYTNKELEEDYFFTFEEKIKITPNLSFEEKFERIRNLYSVDEVAEVIGYNDRSNPNLDYKRLDGLREKDKFNFNYMIYSHGINNGKFEESINANIPYYC